MKSRALGLGLAGVGAACQGAGVGADAWLHAADPTLAAREGVFSLNNVGHLLLVVGIALVVLGVALALAGPSLYERELAARRPLLRTARWVAPIALVGMLAGGTAAASQSTLGRAHDDDDHAAGAATVASAPAAGSTHGHGTPTPAPSKSGTAKPKDSKAAGAGAADADHGHGDGEVMANRPLKPAVRAKLARQLIQARKVGDRYPTIRDAERAGYRRVVRYIPLIGSHYMRFDLVDEKFDIANPEMLLYDGNEPTSRIVGLSYYQKSMFEPEGFAGPNDHWHRHVGLCISTTTFEVIGDEQTTAEDCISRGGVKANITDAWMVHAWVVPGWESPQGVFSAEHADLR